MKILKFMWNYINEITGNISLVLSLMFYAGGNSVCIMFAIAGFSFLILGQLERISKQIKEGK